MTPEEFDAIPPGRCDLRYRYELIRGVLVVSPSPRLGERDPNEQLGVLLWNYHSNHPQGSALDMTASEHTVETTSDRRRCDRAIWAGLGRLPDEFSEVPTIVVEFVSAAKSDAARDYDLKRAEYLAAGVSEYWIIDRFRRVMTVHDRTPEGPRTRTVGESDSYQTERLPGFALPLARLLTLADRWPSRKRRRN